MNTIHTVHSKEAGERLDKVMRKLIPDVSRQKIQNWIKEGYITVNEAKKKPNHVCESGEVISWIIPHEPKSTILPEKLPLDVIYEDASLLVVNKPKRMLVHPTRQVKSGTLVNALLQHSAELSDISGADRPGIVHRLDQDTSGLLLVAKNNTVHERLKTQFKERRVKRVYETVVTGVLQHEQGIINAPIGRNPRNRMQMTVIDSGKEAETHFRVMKHFSQYTHVECELKTGRTHQIRVHMKYINHPIVGDDLYKRKKTSFIQGQALFAKQLGFTHPDTGEPMTFTIQAPRDFQELLDQLDR